MADKATVPMDLEFPARRKLRVGDQCLVAAGRFPLVGPVAALE